jgi:protein-S-isoprenylcysteine O-methyltransferase Ste14
MPNMGLTPEIAHVVLRWMWMAWLLCWLLLGLDTKAVKRKERRIERLMHLVPLGVATLLIFRHPPSDSWRAAQWLPVTSATLAAGLALTLAGLLFSVWARLTLGGNWSATVTIKAEHELVGRGPYRAIRHPIYTGVLMALLGSAVMRGQAGAFVGMAVALGTFWLKARREERFLREEFGASFEEHTRRTGMFLPHLAPRS